MKDLSLRELIYLAIIGVLVVFTHTKDYEEQVKQEAEPRPQITAKPADPPLRAPPCPRFDPTGAPLVSSFATQAHGEEWVHQCDYAHGVRM